MNRNDERNYLLNKRLTEVVVYIYNNRSLDDASVEALLQRMYGGLSVESFMEKTTRIEYVAVLWYIVNHGFTVELQSKILKAIEAGEGFHYLLSKPNYLNDFIKVYENIRGFDASLKPVLAELEEANKIDKIVMMTDEYRHEFIKGCKRLFKEMTYMIGISLIE